MSARKATNKASGPDPSRAEWLASLMPTAAEMKRIAARSGDALYLCDGPVHPDHELLDLCGDALHFAKAAERAHNARPGMPNSALVYTSADEQRTDVWRAELKRVMDEYWRNQHEVTQRLRRARKMKATTPAGIYAKAMLVRLSKTCATELAMSLAADFLDCPGLRESLWPAERISA